MVEGFFKRPPRSLPPELEEARQKIEAIAKRHGLDFFETVFEMCDYDEINMIASYGGFPTRYPHWRWGMEYLQMQKGYEYGLQKIYEMVINTNPSYAYLLDNNLMVDQKLVMAHVFGHVDFFKNNLWFAPTNRKMLDTMANHAAKVRRLIDKVGELDVEHFIDLCLSVDNLIDPYLHHIRRERDVEDVTDPGATHKLPAKSYMDSYINPPEYLEKQRQKVEAEAKRARSFPESPVRDVLGFVLEHGRMHRWQADILDIIRDEAYYFVPQAKTKIMNEGWACVLGHTRVFTDQGLVPMRELVARGAGTVHDGEVHQRVYDRNILPDQPTVTVRTRRGLMLGGSTNHRIQLPSGEWKRLDALVVGDIVRISGGGGLWPTARQAVSWAPEVRMTMEDVARRAGCSVKTVYRHKWGEAVAAAAEIDEALVEWEAQADVPHMANHRAAVRIPAEVDEALGAFLGYLVGDGHISRVKRNLGLTTGDLEQAERFGDLVRECFGLFPTIRKDEGRWRVLVHSEALADFLQVGVGLTVGPSAGAKSIPEVVLRSPEPVVREFLRALFDCDGYAGKQGVILSTMSDDLAEQVQLLLLNYGILSRRRRQKDAAWHVHVAGEAARRFAERVGFGLARKNEALAAYLDSHRWFEAERWEDEIVSIELGRAEVYDISVTESHRYAAGGLVNHNSFWHTKLMTEEILDDSEVIDYADHHSGTVAMRPGQLNPYKVGIEVWRDIKRRWDRGQFGKDWVDCDDAIARRDWHNETNLGHEKIFEVRRTHNDVTFLDTFLTEDLCRRVGLFAYEYDRKTGEYVIESRDFAVIKQKLLFMVSNHGQPRVEVTDGNHANRGELELTHDYEGVDVQLDWAQTTLGNLAHIWGRPVHLRTQIEGKPAVLHHDGTTFTYEGPKPTGGK